MADMLGCDPEEMVFGPNMTTLTFALSRTISRDLQPGDEIVVTRLDHDANVSPWTALEERGCVIRIVDIHPADCTLDMEDLRRKVTPAPASWRWATPPIPWEQLTTCGSGALAHAAGAMAYIDAVHYAPHGPIDVRRSGLRFSGLFPLQILRLRIRARFTENASTLMRLRPYKVRPATDSLPGRWETGTQNHEGLAGVTAAVEYLAELGRRHTLRRRAEAPRCLRPTMPFALMSDGLLEQLVPALLEIPGLTFYGIADPARFQQRVPTVAVRIAGRHPANWPRISGSAASSRGTATITH